MLEHKVQETAFDYEQPLIALKGVGEAIYQKCQKINLSTFRDILFHFPLRYEDRTRITPIQDLLDGQSALIQGVIEKNQVVLRGKKRWQVTLADETGQCQLVFFHFSQFQIKNCPVGAILRVFGAVSRHGFQASMVHPEYQKLTDPQTPVSPYYTPIYPTTKGLSQSLLRSMSKQVLKNLHNPLEVLPLALVDNQNLPSFSEALSTIHYPGPEEDIAQLVSRTHLCYKRLIFEELLCHYFVLKNIKKQNQQLKAPIFKRHQKAIENFIQTLPFALTADQENVNNEIQQDLSDSTPMLRLVQGDVGSGKTLVAALAAFRAVLDGYQVAVMVPTEILSQQHYVNFCQWFEPLGIDVLILNGKMTPKARKEVLAKISQQPNNIIIGTHALFQDKVNFCKLGLVIVDEQHRFGVEQRHRLAHKNDLLSPHQLIMTATPIPRTLCMTQCTHLDLSSITTLPPGRKPIQTLAIPMSKKDDLVERIHRVCEQGRQVYWVSTLIEESEKSEAQAAIMSFELLKAALPQLKIALVHGKLPADEKVQIMRDFKEKKYDVLVATTVIEVGVNVPNATLMIIENAEKLGLSQLHQLRGRVGRGEYESYCVLLYDSPLSPTAKSRLDTMRQSQDGFYIAEMDLKLRGPGEIIGTRQTGLAQYRVCDIFRDGPIIQSIPSIFEQYEKHIKSVHTVMQSRWLGLIQSYSNV